MIAAIVPADNGHAVSVVGDEQTAEHRRVIDELVERSRLPEGEPWRGGLREDCDAGFGGPGLGDFFENGMDAAEDNLGLGSGLLGTRGR